MGRFKNVIDFSLRSPSVAVGERRWFAHFKAERDLSQLLPFVRSTSTNSVFYEFPEYTEFRLDDIAEEST